MDKYVYLGGPIDGLSYEGCNSWREYAIRELAKEGIIGLSPMRGKEFLKKEQVIRGSYKHPLSTDEGLTIRDMWDVRRSGIVLFNLTGASSVSIGSMIEYGWASAFNKPIIAAIEPINRENQNVHEHPMVRSLTAYRVETLDEGLAVAKALFAQG